MVSESIGRGDWIRTNGPLHPMQVRFRTAPHPDRAHHSSTAIALFAERTKDRINTERLATIMRTSIEQLEQTYGKYSDESFRTVVAEAVNDAWGSMSES